jgi:hypothetical protein
LNIGVPDAGIDAVNRAITIAVCGAFDDEAAADARRSLAWVGRAQVDAVIAAIAIHICVHITTWRIDGWIALAPVLRVTIAVFVVARARDDAAAATAAGAGVHVGKVRTRLVSGLAAAGAAVQRAGARRLLAAVAGVPVAVAMAAGATADAADRTRSI